MRSGEGCTLRCARKCGRPSKERLFHSGLSSVSGKRRRFPIRIQRPLALGFRLQKARRDAWRCSEVLNRVTTCPYNPFDTKVLCFSQSVVLWLPCCWIYLSSPFMPTSTLWITTALPPEADDIRHDHRKPTFMPYTLSPFSPRLNYPDLANLVSAQCR